MRHVYFGALLMCCSSLASAATDSMAFVKEMPYRQVVKDMVLARCIAQVSEPNSAYSLDAARSANALREWVPFDIENGNEKINALINKFKNIPNQFHTESAQNVKGVTLNCLRLYHSAELDTLAKDVLVKDPDHTWNQDNANP
ncbi:T6SS amidase immunity protein Tai4 family protein [Kosakonia sp. BK9b]|uniref:T6SS amidase immunity protein Tai4 family protein n=1 Tax=Kosakonia sp. TaxID=1916651 RepID=UPI00289A25C6|nr:T6SS amidase immunity protein Tai4 family protein [Kosakonia sp.]